MRPRIPIADVRPRWLPALLVALALASCTDERRPPLVPTAAVNGATHTVSGNVLGPDGTSICDVLWGGAPVLVRVIDPVNATSGTPFAGSQDLTCPADAYAIDVVPGTYRLRVQLPSDPAIGQLPWRYLQPGSVDVTGGDVVQDVQVLNGTALGGGATLDGQPLAGVSLTLAYDFPAPLSFGVASGVTGGDGAWDDTFRSPLLLQGGERYWVSSTNCTDPLGTRLLSGPPAGRFVFPTEVSQVHCTLETAPAVAYTHDRNHLVVTSMPANIGGGEPARFQQYGRGWGVQFPVDRSTGPVHLPAGASQLFNGGLVIGLEPDVILSGTNMNTEVACGAACVDFGADASVQIVTPGAEGKKIKWTYTDAASGDGVGLKVVQQSWDGAPGADYVLFQYSISNQGAATRTFYAGIWADWDVAGTYTTNIGYTDLDGRLMYMTNPGGGIHVGTLLLGDAPVSGNFFYNWSTLGSTRLSLVDQVRALRGDLRRPSIGEGDNRVFHAMGPITLRRNKSVEVRIAVVAGESLAELLANARAAAARVGAALPPAP